MTLIYELKNKFVLFSKEDEIGEILLLTGERSE